MPQAIMEIEQIEQRIASDQLIEGVPWDWVVINGRMARCINPFVDLPDAADGWKSVQRPIRLPWGRLTHPSELLKIGQEIDVVILDSTKRKSAYRLDSNKHSATHGVDVDARTKMHPGCRPARNTAPLPSPPEHFTNGSYRARLANNRIAEDRFSDA
jgi:hypothetical protein